jgi:hypothetical protein
VPEQNKKERSRKNGQWGTRRKSVGGKRNPRAQAGVFIGLVQDKPLPLEMYGVDHSNLLET